MINKERLKENLMRISCIGEMKDGGVDRVFGSEYMKECQIEVKEYFEECGMKAYIDSVGNVHGIYGNNSAEKEIFIGSHIDTVKAGGKFDGVMGVVAGAEIIRAFAEKKAVFNKNIHIVATNGEEGNELDGTFGSRAMMGLLPYDSKEYLKKAEKYGFSLQNLLDAKLDIEKIACFLEMHIEQGPTLYNNHEKIGIVSGIVGLRRYKVTVNGKSNHAGTTMMADREDALVAAAKIIVEGDRLAREMGNNFVETVGIMNVYPGSAPVIPNKAEMILEIRNENSELMDKFIDEYSQMATKTANVEIEQIVSKKPVKCSKEIIEIMNRECSTFGAAYRNMPSGATHDGNAFALNVPIGMIFVPSIDGISHAKEENTEWEDIYTGTELFAKVIEDLEEC